MVRPDVVTSLIVRLCLEVTPVSPVSGSHRPFLLVLHVIMLVRNAAGLHLEDETEALSSYFSLMVASFMSVQDAARWLAGCLGVTEQALDVRSRITVCGSLSILGCLEWGAKRCCPRHMCVELCRVLVCSRSERETFGGERSLICTFVHTHLPLTAVQEAPPAAAGRAQRGTNNEAPQPKV